MSNYYINNNRGIYGNQNNNNYRPGQNFYSNNNNYNRQQGNYQNNYNKGNYYQNQNNNYQQQNYNNQNQNNNAPQPFISAYMGGILISSDTLDSFGKSLKSVEWTNNPHYLQAKNINVKMKLSLKGQLQSNINIPRNRFNDYNLNSNLNSNFDMNNFINYINDINENKDTRKQQIENEKNNFMRNNFPNERYDLNMKDLYIKIGQNRKDVIIKDSSLYSKVERLLPLLKPVEVPKDFGKKEDNIGAPSGPQLINQDSGNDAGKIFTNTPGF